MAYPGHPCRGCAIPWNGGITVWQNTRVAILFDLSYLLDTAWRFAVGQVPYRDLPFSHAPLTFLLHAAVITLFGWVYYPHVVLGAIEAGAATVLTWRLLLRTGWGGRWGWAMVLTSPLVVLGIRDYPHPDLRQRGYTRGANRDMAAAQSRSGRFASGGSSRGATCVVPLFFKQKIGLAFLGGVRFLGVAAVVAWRRREDVAALAWVVAGIAGALVLALVGLQWTGLRNYLYGRIYAAQQWPPDIAVLMIAYRQQLLVWSVPAAVGGVAILRWRPGLRVLSFRLLAAPFVWTMISFPVWRDPDERADHLLALWPHILIVRGGICSLAAAHGRRQGGASLPCTAARRAAGDDQRNVSVAAALAIRRTRSARPGAADRRESSPCFRKWARGWLRHCWCTAACTQ